MSNASTPETRPAESSGGETLRTIVFAVLIALVIRTFAFEPFNIPSSSMVPTLLIGDFLFVSKYSYGYGSRGTFWGLVPFKGRIPENEGPKRGEIVVFKWPKDNSTDYIKRVIGLPGDKVQMKDGLLYINGKVVDRARLPSPVLEPGETLQEPATDYIEHLPEGPEHVIRKRDNIDDPLDNTEEFAVPPGHYFMMGDNRDNSQDSRTTNVGYVPEENLVGRARLIFFSLKDDVRFWQVWKWPWAVRWDRLFRTIE
ncbi:MAG: signal peptidase I [Bdellovibrionales bacterium]